jgi:S1-C subfamily serine protease
MPGPVPRSRAAAALVLLGALALSAPPGRAEDIGELFRKVSPTVVVIRARGREVTSVSRGVSFFDEVGSGVLISADGKVMTAAHVVHAMDEVTVEFLGGETVRGRIVASEPAADLSLLQLESVPPGAPAAVLGNSDRVQVGDQVIVVGAPYGLSHSLSVGWISGRYAPNTVHRAMPLAEFLQTTAPINQGNSGGPMFNRAGEVVGIVSHNISKSGGSEGLGFVVSGNSARQLLLEQPAFWNGIDGTLLTGELAEIFNVPQPAGYLVKTVARGSPAWDMGIQGGDRVATVAGQELVVRGDIILTVGPHPVGAVEDFVKMRTWLAGLRRGQAITVRVLRAGHVVELSGRVP